MGLKNIANTWLVATLLAALIAALFTGLLAGSCACMTASPAHLQADAVKDCSEADIGTCTIDCESAQQQATVAGQQPLSKLLPDNRSHVKYNTITDRADTLDRHPVLMDNPDAHKPSYRELMDFLKDDDTVKNKYDYPNYTCANFAVELQHKAESKGIHCGYAGLNFAGKETGHAINVFPTTDEGLVYVDLTCGKRIITKNLKAGMRYYNMGIIESIKLYW